MSHLRLILALSVAHFPTHLIEDAMARNSILNLLAAAEAQLPDNTTGLITAGGVRQLLIDVIETFSPGYAIVSIDSLSLVALGITPQIIKYDIILAQTPEYFINPGAGEITRVAQGLPSTVNRISFYADLAAPTGDEVVFSLFRDGVDIPGGSTVSGQGLGNVVQAAFSVGNSGEDTLDHIYDVRATKVTGGADNVELANVRFILEYVPTIGI
jgi:hypothetical protein